MRHAMYDELAEYWPLLSPVSDYREEAHLILNALSEFSQGAPRQVLELGSGGGHNAFHLKSHFALTLVDLSPAMLQQSRRLNPELPHHQGDMRDCQLGRVFDAVYIHDAISYMTTRAQLERAMATAFRHCRPGGVALFLPDETKESFVPETSSGGSDDERWGFRYLEWVWDPDPNDQTIVADYAFLIRDPDHNTRVVHERHTHGLFPEQVWLDTLERVGFAPHTRTYEHSELKAGYRCFIGVRPVSD